MSKKSKIWFLFLITILLSILNSSKAQSVIKYIEQSVVGSVLPQVRIINFVDTISGHVKSFDIVKGNPFNNLRFKIIGKNEMGNFIFELSSDDVLNLIPSSYREGYMIDRRNLPAGNFKYSGTTYPSIYKDAKRFLVIGYTFLVRIEGYAVGTLSSILVFNNFGIRIYQENMINVDVGEVVVTDDGRYLCFDYGGETDEDGSLFHKGYRIIEIKTKKIIVDQQHDNLGSPAIAKNLIITSYDTNEDQRKCIFTIYCPNQKCLYTKGYTLNEMATFTKITQEGIQFYDKDKNITTDLFEGKFKKETLK